jgi:hypothetical protein
MCFEYSLFSCKIILFITGTKIPNKINHKYEPLWGGSSLPLLSPNVMEGFLHVVTVLNVLSPRNSSVSFHLFSPSTPAPEYQPHFSRRFHWHITTFFHVVIHMCMEAMLGISLYSYSYLKLAKTLCLSYYCLCLLFNKIRDIGRTGSAWKWEECRGEGRGWGKGKEMTQEMYTHMNKWIKKKRPHSLSWFIKIKHSAWTSCVGLLHSCIVIYGQITISIYIMKIYFQATWLTFFLSYKILNLFSHPLLTD